MSRIGKLPITVPAGVTVTVGDDNTVTVKGPKGELTQAVNRDITLKQEAGVIYVERPSDAKPHRAMHGLYRSLINNMVVGVTEGFSKTLVMVGTGYRAQAEGGKKLTINIGFSHPVILDGDDDLKFTLRKTDRYFVGARIFDGVDQQTFKGDDLHIGHTGAAFDDEFAPFFKGKKRIFS